MVALAKYVKRKKAPDCTVFTLGISSKTPRQLQAVLLTHKKHHHLRQIPPVCCAFTVILLPFFLFLIFIFHSIQRLGG